MHEQVIRSLRRHLAAILMLKHALLWLAIGAFAWGTFVIVWRVASGAAAYELWWGLAAAPVLALIAAGLALRQLPSRTSLRAVVDRAGGCGGLLMAAEERQLGSWERRLPEPSAVRVRWRGGRVWSAFLAGVAFVLFALLFPQELVSLAGDRPLDITQEAAQLSAQLEVLKEESVIEPQRAEFLKDRLKQLQDDAKGLNPVKTLEALDHLRDITNKAAKDAAESALSKTEKLGQAEGLAEGIRQNDGELDAKVEKEALDTLAGLVQKAAAETNLLDKLDPDLLKKLQSGKLSADQLKKLAAALKGSKMDLSKMLAKLHAAKLIDAEFLKMCENAGQCDCAGLLKEQGGKMSVRQIMGQCKNNGNGAGKGGVTEGGGSTPITWDHHTKEDGTKFKEETLPPGALAKLKESMLVGVGRADPEANQQGPSQGGALSGARAGGGAANTQVVLPRHRATVERFFARPKDK